MSVNRKERNGALYPTRVWSSAGFTQEVLGDDSTTQTIVAKTLLNGTDRQFLRLSVIKP